MNLPRHIVDNVERRWAVKLEREVLEWRKRKSSRSSEVGIAFRLKRRGSKSVVCTGGNHIPQIAIKLEKAPHSAIESRHPRS